jgi:hypothetical protein
MTLNEAILLLAVCFMIIVGIWLTALTYLVLARGKADKAQKEAEEKELSEITDEKDN